MNRQLQADGLSIQALHACDAPRVVAHLTRLSPEDRGLRFNASLADDAQIARYVGQIRFGEDIVLGLVDATGRVVGVAHGCVFEAGGERRVEAAFSVDGALRGLGLATTLMRSLQAAASRHGVVVIVGFCAARNRPMRRVFERAGMTLTREEDEVHARLALEPGVSALHGSVRSGRSGKQVSARNATPSVTAGPV